MLTEVKICNKIVVDRNATFNLDKHLTFEQIESLLDSIKVCDLESELWGNLHTSLYNDSVVTGEELMWLGWVLEAFYDLDSELWGSLYKELIKIGGTK